MNWYTIVSKDVKKLYDAIAYYTNEIEEASKEMKMYGNIETASRKLPGIVEHRFRQLQETEAILEFLNIQMRKLKVSRTRHYMESYHRKGLSMRDAEKYADGDDDVTDMATLINDFAVVRNGYLGIMKGLEVQNWQLSNIVKLRVAGLDDAKLE